MFCSGNFIIITFSTVPADQTACQFVEIHLIFFELIQKKLCMTQLKPKGNTAVNIAQSIEQLIRRKVWSEGYRLPTVRSLADELGVNPNTVSAAYKQLRDAGIIDTDGRRGSFVPHKTEILHSETAIPQGLVDLASGNVDRRLLPPLASDLFNHYSLNADVGNYGDHPELMKFLKNWLVEHIGIESEVMLLSSSLDIMERILMQRCISGSKVLIEDPCWPPLPALLATLRLEAVPLQMDDEGAVIPEQLNDDFSVVILTPRAHSPTGINYSRARWQQWQAFLNQRDGLLIVDDHWAALSQQPFYGMQGFEGEWMYTTSTSKFLGTNARIAIAAGNSNILHAMKKRFALGPRWISKILQHLTLQLWQRLEGEAMHEISENYRIRRQTLFACLNQHGIFPLGKNGEGFHIWLPVANEAQVIQFLAAKGWAVQSCAAFHFAKRGSVRITFSNLDLADCARLADDIAETLNAGRKTIY